MLAMVKRTRIVFSPQDIVQMRIVCGECKGESSYPFTVTFDVPDSCPYCHNEWALTHGGQPFPVKKHAINLAKAIHYFLNPENVAVIEDLAFELQLEINGEDPSV